MRLTLTDGASGGILPYQKKEVSEKLQKREGSLIELDELMLQLWC
jgi:hypothetical protein